MRKLGITVVAFLAVFMVVDLLSGQQPFPFGGFGGGKGGPDPLNLVRNPQVKKELDITDEQLEKLPDAVMKALSEVLNDKQLKRLREIELQQRGPRAFSDSKIQKSLKFSEEQRDSVATILDDARKEMGEIFKDLKGSDFKVIGEKIQAFNKDTNEKLTKVLTAEQKRAWKQMQGDEFKMTLGGGFFKKGPKKDEPK